MAATESQQVDLQTIPISPDGQNEAQSPSGDQQATVFHDKDNFNVKHPLMHKWTLWFTKPPSGKVRSSQERIGLDTDFTQGRQLEWFA